MIDVEEIATALADQTDYEPIARLGGTSRRPELPAKVADAKPP
jgi:hypothetical protein